MQRTLVVLLCMLVGLFAGCANSERINASVYEGLNARNAILDPSANHNPTGKPLPYQEYEAERKKLMENTARK
jgi:hypothetical protein